MGNSFNKLKALFSYYFNQLKSKIELIDTLAISLIFAFVGTVVSGSILINRSQVYSYEDTVNQTVRLVRPSNHGTGGTAFAVKTQSGNVYTVSNAHVCELAEEGKMHALIHGSKKFYTLYILDKSSEYDLCLLTSMPNYEGLNLGSTYKLGDITYIVGNPYLKDGVESSGKIYAEDLTWLPMTFNGSKEECPNDNRHRWQDLSETFFGTFFNLQSWCLSASETVMTTALVYPGNSGSPVLNKYGQVIGVAYISDGQTNHGGFIPLYQLKDFLRIY